MVQLRTALENWCCDKAQSLGPNYVIPASPLAIRCFYEFIETTPTTIIYSA
jgi:hypothetical protein